MAVVPPTPDPAPPLPRAALPVRPRRFDAARRGVDRLLQRASLPMLRVSLGLIFVWFGGLKLAGTTPVTELVAGTLPWVDPELLVRTLGGFEVAVGTVLISGYLLGWVCAVMVAHLGGTYLTVVMQPHVLFQDGNPLMLTMEGEFVVKNLVLITAVLVVAAWSRRIPPVRRPDGHPLDGERRALEGSQAPGW